MCSYMAFMWFLSRMNLDVLLKVSQLGKVPPADIALVWFLTAVNPQVHLENREPRTKRDLVQNK